MDRAWLVDELRRLREQLGSDTALASALGLKHSGHIPRLLDADKGVVPSVETCLHLAGATGHHPDDVLRAAGHEHVIPVLRAAYARRRSQQPQPEDTVEAQAVARAYSELTDAQRHAIHAILAACGHAVEPAAKGGRRVAQKVTRDRDAGMGFRQAR